VPDWPAAKRVTLTGQIHDRLGVPMAGATVRLLEENTTATTDASGYYSLDVPTASTVSLKASKAGYADTLFHPFELAADATKGEASARLWPIADVEAYNELHGSNLNRAVLAVQVISLSGQCNPGGATVQFGPTEVSARTLYVPSGECNPDPVLTNVQDGALTSAYTVGVVPGSYYWLKVQKPACAQADFPVQFKGQTYIKDPPVAAKTVTEMNLFVQ
jgi:hypothetical protein